MRILVTGASGWLARTLIPRLARDGHTVVSLDPLPSPLTTVQGSIADRALVRRTLRAHGIEAIVHAGAVHKPQVDRLPMSEFVAVNVQGTLNLLEACRRHKVRRLVVTSTSEVYGTAQYTPIDEKRVAALTGPLGRADARADLPRFAGWWGNDESTRFEMKKGFRPAKGAEGWQISNAQVFQMAALRASLDVFDQADFTALAAKRDSLTGYLEFLLQRVIEDFPALDITIITPPNPQERGCQLSLLANSNGRELYNYLTSKAIIVDWREPNVIRAAPVPLYNSYEDVYVLAETIRAYAAGR